MSEQNEKLLINAREARSLYKCGLISRKEMESKVIPFIDNYNKIATEKSIKYNMKTRKLSLASYLRSKF